MLRRVCMYDQDSYLPWLGHQACVKGVQGKGEERTKLLANAPWPYQPYVPDMKKDNIVNKGKKLNMVSLIPLVFSTTGRTAHECSTFYRRLADLM